MAYARMQPVTEKWDKMAHEISPEFDNLLIRQQRPEATMRRLEEAVGRILAAGKEGP